MKKQNTLFTAIIISTGIMSAFSTTASASPVNLVLRLKERTSIETLANSVTNPSSPRYKKFYTPTELKALVAPNDADYQQLVQTLKQKGFEITRESPSHLVISVRGEQKDVEAVVHAKLNRVGMRVTGTQSAVKLAQELSLIDSVSGLDQTQRLRPHYRRIGASLRPRTGKLAPRVDQASIKTAYGFDPIYASGVSGKGQHIAIATYDGFHMDDINQFFVQSSISPAPVVDQVNFNGSPAVNEDSAVETALDAEFSGMIAPGAQIHVFASNENSDAGELAMFTAILDDNRAKVVNYSWGECENDLGPAHQADMDKVYARAVAQGVNIIVASGDSGAAGCQNNSAKVADWPASQPNAVAVGGTRFSYSNGALSETAWSGSGQMGGSGGGISKLYDLPSYQSNFTSPYVKRSFPDVAFNADPASGQDVWAGGTWQTVGGTSMAAPQWSGFMALVGESRATAGKGTLGFLNPIIYSLSAADRAKVLHDVTSGSNGYPAGPGWDAVTGWGSMQADALLNYLTQQ